MNEKHAEVLRVVGHLLEYHGTTGESARDVTGRHIIWSSPLACNWCLVGAICAVSSQFGLDYEQVLESSDRLFRDIYRDVECTFGAWEGSEKASPERRASICKILQNLELYEY